MELWHTYLVATLCVGKEPIAFLAIFDERPRGGSLKILGPKARHFFGSLCLNDCLTTTPVIYCDVCLCPTSQFVEQPLFPGIAQVQLVGVGRSVESVGTHS